GQRGVPGVGHGAAALCGGQLAIGGVGHCGKPGVAHGAAKLGHAGMPGVGQCATGGLGQRGVPAEKHVVVDGVANGTSRPSRKSCWMLPSRNLALRREDPTVPCTTSASRLIQTRLPPNMDCSLGISWLYRIALSGMSM